MSFLYFLVFFRQKTAYEMRISDWSSDVCSSDLDSRDGALDDMAFEAVGAAERLLEHGREIIAGGVCRSGHKNVVPELTFSGRPVGSGGLVAETAAHAEYGRGIQTNERKRRNRR